MVCVSLYPVQWRRPSEKDAAEQFKKDAVHIFSRPRQVRKEILANLHNDTAIMPGFQYWHSIMYRNFSGNWATDHICETTASADVRQPSPITVRLKSHEVSNETDRPQFIQAGFETIGVPELPLNRPGVVQIPFIYTIPTGAWKNLFIKNSGGTVLGTIPYGTGGWLDFEITGGSTIHLFSNSENTVMLTILTPNKFSPLLDANAEWYLVAEIYNVSQEKIIMSKGIRVIHYKFTETEFYQEARQESKSQAITAGFPMVTEPVFQGALLAIGKQYELRFSAPAPYNISDMTLLALKLRPVDGRENCAMWPIRTYEMNRTCGVLSFMQTDMEAALEKTPIQFVILLRMTAACALITMPLPGRLGSEIRPPAVIKLTLTPVDPKEFGYEEFMQPKLLTWPKNISSGSELLSGTTLRLRCLIPVCLYDQDAEWCFPDANDPDANRKHTSCTHAQGLVDLNRTELIQDTSRMKFSREYLSEYTVAFDMMIESLRTNNTGWYSCNILKANRKLEFSDAIGILVVDPTKPRFRDEQAPERELILPSNGTLSLSCQADGKPRPEIFWTWELSKRTMSLRSPRLNGPGDNATLDVFQAGTYSCRAVNPEGEIHRKFTVRDEAGSPVLTLAIAIPLTIVISAVLALLLWWRRQRAIAASFENLSEILKSPLEAEIDRSLPLNDQADALPYNQRYELELGSFEVTPYCLGTGEFGKVFKGRLLTNGTRLVAIKVPRDLKKVEHFRTLIEEFKIMSHIRPHVNVLNLLGACTSEVKNRQLYVITEFCENGSLKEYLSENYIRLEGFSFDMARNQFRGTEGAVETLLKYAYQAANGMEHLAAQNIIHRDLALRNLLLTSGQIVKISDFGLSRCRKSVYSRAIADGDPVPITWMALESLLHGQYSEKSDVWSFGVVLWEIFSCGRKKPYADCDCNTTVFDEFCSWLRENEENRLGRPTIACEEIYQLMLTCWKVDREIRPSFSECKRIISRILEERSLEEHQQVVVALSDAWANMLLWQEQRENPSYSNRQAAASNGLSSMVVELEQTGTVAEQNERSIDLADFRNMSDVVTEGDYGSPSGDGSMEMNRMYTSSLAGTNGCPMDTEDTHEYISA